MFHDEVLRDPEAKAGAAQLLRCKERIKHLLLHLQRNALPSIMNRNPHSFATDALNGADTNGDIRAWRRGFCSIADDVSDDLAELPRESVDRPRGSAVAHNANPAQGRILFE